MEESDYAFEVAGIAFGDEGKGTIVDYLTWKYGVEHIVRYNGGPQAAHHVVNSQDIVHCFSQFGSGTFHRAGTLLSSKMLIDPIRMKNEANILKEKGIINPLNCVIINPNCLIVTPFHGILNQMLEISRGKARHGSCGIGVGQAAGDKKLFGEMALVAVDMFDKEILKSKLDFLWRIKIDLAQQLVAEHPDTPELNKRVEQLTQEDYVQRLVFFYHNFAAKSGVQISCGKQNVLAENGNIIFEGAQGVLLDEDRGFYPYVTHSSITFKNADEILRRHSHSKKIIKIGVLRAYSTRHGEGPFVSEDDWLTAQVPDCHNGKNEWQGIFKVGWFDLIATRYALEVVGKIDCVALTNFDRLNFEQIKVCRAYKYEGEIDEFMDQFFKYEKDENGDIIIQEIKLQSDPTPKVQSRLTELLKFCKPVYCNVKREEYIKFLEEKLKIEISIVSVGPKATDKIELRPLC